MDDVDAVQAQIARNMLDSGDWVTARLDGVVYLEKAPLIYWIIAISYKFLGIHDWVARIPIALSAILLCWVTLRFGAWAFGRRAGYWAGLCLATCVGLFLFTRILIPDVMLTLTGTLAMWAFLRVLEDDETHPRAWAMVLAACLGAGLLLKGLLAVVLPAGAALVYLALTRQLFSARTWERLRPISGLVVILLIAAPWHILATRRNPPYFDFTLRSGPGMYRGFFWFYFINEHVLRFLNLRYPRDYNTVPRLAFWLLNLVWLFPWSAYAPAAFQQSYRTTDRAGRARVLALCWAGFLMVFFTFSTTQEYYSMPCYPAFALLLGSAMASESAWIRRGTRSLAAVAATATVVLAFLFFKVRGIPAPGDIASALTQHPLVYTLSLGHLGDLTLGSFAYLRLPLLVAGVAFLVGALGAWRFVGQRAFLALALMMVVFFHAARLAMVVFDPYLSSRPLAEALRSAPQGQLIVDGAYYPFSSVFFYANRQGLLWNGRVNNLEYGSFAPGAPHAFIDNADFEQLWFDPARCFLIADRSVIPRLERLVGRSALYQVAESGGKLLLTNEPLRVSLEHSPMREGRQAKW
jgi:4-amino-4-deoxy-L-arabinose transferase-like glycosyltransferase